MDKFVRLTATACPLSLPNLNTDQILPARYLKWPRSKGLGTVLFDDVRLDARFESPAVPSTPAIDLSTLPPPIALDAVGFSGDWPALAVSLGLTGVAHQLAFNSELTELDGLTLALSVPVPQYADAAQVAKLKAALAEALGTAVDVRVTVGPARRTAALLEAAARAERQREAEREISADPFVQSLIREFGASIVPGSVRPVAPGAEGGAGVR